MKRNLRLWQLAGFAASTLFGTLLHFLYDWTGSLAVALISAVNESTWEHMKLIFFPMLAFAIVEYFFIGKEYQNYWCVKLQGILLSLVLIPVLFYTLRGIFGTTPDWVNIALFFVSAAAGFLLETLKLQKGSSPCRTSSFAIAALVILALAFLTFTFTPPEILLFQDPIDQSYGINLIA